MTLLDEGSNWRKWDLHIHTKSSHDYNYSGKEYFDEELVEAWKEKEFIAVAITDHFKIDGNRIKKLQNLARKEGITVFPGVEYRTDKGDKNVHMISIFSNEIDVIELGKEFHYSMIKGKAKNAEDHTTIYWHLEDIVEFKNKHKGLLTVHAGDKASGIDRTMNHQTFFNAIKIEYAKVVDAFEVNNLNSYLGYQKKVIPHIENKFQKEFAVIVSSDNHDYSNYKISTSLWIKADPTFDGLKQAFLHPTERIFIGEEPEKITHRKHSAKKIIKSIDISKKDGILSDYDWFNSKIPLNSSLIAIIGNKGSGKSALSDILGVANNFTNIDMLSFLNPKRFNKPPNYYGKEYKVELTWLDNEKTYLDNLDINPNEKDLPIATAQYLPQKHIEEICTNLDNSVFQNEINKLIFSYISPEEKLNADTFEDFISLKTESIESELLTLYNELNKINQKIIEIEKKKKEEYLNTVNRKIKELESDLKRQIAAKPKEVKKIIDKQDDDKNIEFNKIKNKKEEITKEIDAVTIKLTKKNLYYQKLINAKSDIDNLIKLIKTKNKQIEELFIEAHVEDINEFKINYSNPELKYDSKIEKVKKEKEYLEKLLRDQNGLEKRLEKIKREEKEALELIDEDHKAFQTYLEEQEIWQKKIEVIKGNKNEYGSLEYYKEEIQYLNKKLSKDYSTLKRQQLEIIKNIYIKKSDKRIILDDIYKVIDDEIKQTLGKLNQDIQFETKLIVKNKQAEELLIHVNKRAKSDFQGSEGSIKELNKMINELDVTEFKSVSSFVEKMLSCGTDKNYDQLDKVINDKNKYYDEVTTLEYIEVDYHLTYDGLTISELSPGERGLMLLIFYLALSKDDKPIIIDQPEDNLDNQSVYSRLVPSIVAAKKKRQVIVVTHNPNIAIACDAEQIIVADINKNNNEIQYTSGSIENKIINNKIVEILEGTRPAFNLRDRKYLE